MVIRGGLKVLDTDNVKNMKYDFDDISIIPAEISEIRSRSEINPYDEYGFLPIIVSPMDTVINKNNAQLYLDCKLHICAPRNETADYYDLDTNGGLVFNSYSLVDFIERYLDDDFNDNDDIVLIDMANGHMRELLDTIVKAKEKHTSMKLMVGNIANPKTYKLLSEAGADYIRISIGSGSACLTAEQTAINFPIASLIQECYDISCTLDNPAKIVADGGMKSYSDIIKALALGADYVMIGSLFNKTIESAGENYIFKNIKVSKNIASWFYNHGFTIHKSYRGMSTKEVQKKWGAKILKTSEGIVTKRKVEYKLDGWTENFVAYLKSAMSYTNSKKNSDFVLSEKILISNNAYKRYNK